MFAWLLGISLSLPVQSTVVPPATVLVIVGAEGTPEYGRDFASWSDRWKQTAVLARAQFELLTPSASAGAETAPTPSQPDLSQRDRLRAWLAESAPQSTGPLWLVLIGHGTTLGTQAKFNLEGPDVAASELQEWLQPLQRPLVVINCTASSSPFLNALSQPGRVVITATRSGTEHNFARFGDFFSSAVTDPAADLDKDEQTSLLEAFLAAAHRVDRFYQEASRLTTEHALLDDNGDGRGTPADWFTGIRVTQQAAAGTETDGLRAHQWHLVPNAREQQLTPAVRGQRTELEVAIEALRQQKATLPEAEYYERLEALLLPLARWYREHIPAAP